MFYCIRSQRNTCEVANQSKRGIIQLAGETPLKSLTTALNTEALHYNLGLESGNFPIFTLSILPPLALKAFSHLISLFCCLFWMLPFQAEVMTLLRALIKSGRQQDWTQLSVPSSRTEHAQTKPLLGNTALAAWSHGVGYEFFPALACLPFFDIGHTCHWIHGGAILVL